MLLCSGQGSGRRKSYTMRRKLYGIDGLAAFNTDEFLTSYACYYLFHFYMYDDKTNKKANKHKIIFMTTLKMLQVR